ncbi:hypothetical protein V3331_16990 [Gaopeijia maritima]
MSRITRFTPLAPESLLHQGAALQPAAAQVGAAARLNRHQVAQKARLLGGRAGTRHRPDLVVEGHHAHLIVGVQPQNQIAGGPLDRLELAAAHAARTIEHEGEIDGNPRIVGGRLALDAQERPHPMTGGMRVRFQLKRCLHGSAPRLIDAVNNASLAPAH